MNKESTKSKIVEAAKELMIDVGFESMSPAMVLEHSGAGKGSLYHHFSGKKALARVVLEAFSKEMKADIRAIFDRDDLTGLQKIDRYLNKQRNGLMGCKFGRLSNEKAMQDPVFSAQIADYFNFVREKIVTALRQEQKAGSFNSNLEIDAVAEMLISTVQGGYVLSKATHDAEAVNRAANAARAMLFCCLKGKD